MTPFHKVRLVARREFVERIKDKSFAISTVTIVGIVLAVVLLPALFGYDGGPRASIGVVDDTAAFGATLDDQAEAFGLQVTIEQFNGAAAAEQAVDDGDLAAAVLPGPELVTDGTPSPQLATLIQTVWAAQARQAAVEAAGLDRHAAEQLLAPPPLPHRTLGEETDTRLIGVAAIAMMVLYGQLFGYGMWVASGIVEEKSTRVVEVLLSSTRPRHLLAGKILGIGALGLLQLLLTAGLGLGAVLATGLVDLPPGTTALLAQVVLWFVLGYAFYSCAFAMTGAIVPRQEELQNAMTPLMMVIFVSFFAAFAALQDPAGAVAQIASLVPFSAPLTMPIRMAAGTVAGWEIAVAVTGTLTVAVALVPLAGRVYQGAVLRTGSRVKLRHALAAGR